MVIYQFHFCRVVETQVLCLEPKLVLRCKKNENTVNIVKSEMSIQALLIQDWFAYIQNEHNWFNKKKEDGPIMNLGAHHKVWLSLIYGRFSWPRHSPGGVPQEPFIAWLTDTSHALYKIAKEITATHFS